MSAPRHAQHLFHAIDADALKPYLPRGGAPKVLVTSNAHAWRGVAVPVEIRLWPKEIGADYLTARTGRDAERAAAEILSEALGGLPLAHEQAAAYCERLDISLGEYGRRFAATPARLLDDARHAPAEYHDGLTVAKTFALAIDEAAKLHSGAEHLIVHAALLAPEPIPLFLFSEPLEKFGEPLATALAGDGLDEAVAALRAFALIDRPVIADERDPTITTDTMRLHRLVREVAAARRTGERRNQARHALIAAFTAVYPGDGVRNPSSWARCQLLTQHLLTICETDADAVANVECADLLNRAGNYFHGRTAFSRARPLKEHALAIHEQILGPEHPEMARSLRSLALLFRDQGDYAGARPLVERALTISEKVHGPEHPETANCLIDLACLLRAQGDYKGAQPLAERSLAIRQKTNGPEHVSTAISLRILALLMWEQGGNLAKVQPLLERTLAIFEKTLGAEHPFTAFLLADLGALLRDLGDYAGARPLAERALAIQEKVRGPEHLDTAKLLKNLASLLQAQGDLPGALPLLERALAINEKALDLSHCWTKDSARVTAELLEALGRRDEAASVRARFGLSKQRRV